MKCEECGSSQVFVDAVEDKEWCKACGHIEDVQYRPIGE
jgi:uncharacterized protein (DUF983 family)